MAATVYLEEYNGESGSEVATSKQGGTIRFKSADDATVDESNPLIKPNAGVYRSYEKYLRAYLEDLDESTDIQNVEIFTSSTAKGGVAIYAKTAAAYATPKSGGYDAAGAMAGDKVDLFTKTSDDPISLGDGPFDTETSAFGLYLVLQMECYPSASQGQSSSVDLILRYDETE